MDVIKPSLRTRAYWKGVGAWRRMRPLAGRFGQIIRDEEHGEYHRIIQLLRPVVTEHALIRVGGDGDGGYIVPDDLDGIEACFSPGVGYIATFEKALLERGIRVFQIDASVEQTPCPGPNTVFEKKFLGIRTRDNVITLDDWVREKMPVLSGDLLLEIDIEGHEWLALAQVSDETLLRFRIIVIELHLLSHMLDGLAPVFEPVLSRLAQHFDVIHVHPNNGAVRLSGRSGEAIDVFEVTYLRKDRSQRRDRGAPLPHPLDQDNAPHLRPLHIPPSFFA